jgi:hypothetical protein
MMVDIGEVYIASPLIQNVVNAAAPYLFAINVAQSFGLAVIMDNKKIATHVIS